MTTLPHAEHVIRKKAYAPHYVPSHLNLFQPEMHDFTLELMDVSFETDPNWNLCKPGFADPQPRQWKKGFPLYPSFPPSYG